MEKGVIPLCGLLGDLLVRNRRLAVKTSLRILHSSPAEEKK
jgi:hypothetical protein